MMRTKLKTGICLMLAVLCMASFSITAFASDEKYAKWRYDDLPIVPADWKYKIPRDKYSQFETLKKLMHRADVSDVINACDAGREGELIFRNIYKMTGCKKPIYRLWISSMEDDAIKQGFRELKDGKEYDNLFEKEQTDKVLPELADGDELTVSSSEIKEGTTKGMSSEKTGKSYDATLVLSDDGTKTVYGLAFGKK